MYFESITGSDFDNYEQYAVGTTIGLGVVSFGAVGDVSILPSNDQLAGDYYGSPPVLVPVGGLYNGGVSTTSQTVSAITQLFPRTAVTFNATPQSYPIFCHDTFFVGDSSSNPLTRDSNSVTLQFTVQVSQKL